MHRDKNTYKESNATVCKKAFQSEFRVNSTHKIDVWPIKY